MILDDDRGTDPEEQVMSAWSHPILPNTRLASAQPGSTSSRWVVKVGTSKAARLEHQTPKAKNRMATKAGIFPFLFAIKPMSTIIMD